MKKTYNHLTYEMYRPINNAYEFKKRIIQIIVFFEIFKMLKLFNSFNY